MRIIDPGHVYALQHLESVGEEILRFIKRSGGPAHYDEEYPGTTTQEVIRAAIDRTKFVNTLLPCEENFLAISAGRMFLYWLERRAWLRKAQQLARVNAPHQDGKVPFTAFNVERYPICQTCGHIFCLEHKEGHD